MYIKDNMAVTCIMLDLSDDREKRLYDLLQHAGNFKKRFIVQMLACIFPDYYSSGKIDGQLQDYISAFYKEYKKQKSDNPIFFSWSKGNNYDDRTATLLNKHLGSGAKDFLVEVLSKYFSTYFNPGIVIKYDEKKPMDKHSKTSEPVEPTVATPSPNPPVRKKIQMNVVESTVPDNTTSVPNNDSSNSAGIDEEELALLAIAEAGWEKVIHPEKFHDDDTLSGDYE